MGCNKGMHVARNEYIVSLVGLCFVVKFVKRLSDFNMRHTLIFSLYTEIVMRNVPPPQRNIGRTFQIVKGKKQKGKAIPVTGREGP
jgi:hypothetical protein